MTKYHNQSVDKDVQHAKNRYALTNPEAGDAWETHSGYTRLVIAVVPETFSHPKLVVVCTCKFYVTPRRWTWDVEETREPFRVYTQAEYVRSLCYKGTDEAWANACKARFGEFVSEVPDKRVMRAVKRWQRNRWKATLTHFWEHVRSIARDVKLSIKGF